MAGKASKSTKKRSQTNKKSPSRPRPAKKQQAAKPPVPEPRRSSRLNPSKGKDKSETGAVDKAAVTSARTTANPPKGKETPETGVTDATVATLTVTATDENESLRRQIEVLEGRVQSWLRWRDETMTRHHWLEGSALGWNVQPVGVLGKSMEAVLLFLFSWTGNYAHPTTDILSSDQKRKLVADLDGFIVQDDLDVIESGLPGQFVEIYLSVLVYAWLMKDIIGRFFTNPFWYVDIQPDSENINMDEVRRGTTAFGADLYAFWKTVQPENKRYSQPWRMWAVRLCNPSDPTWMGSDWGGKDFGDKEVAHRKAMTSAMCDHVLAGEFLQSMLKPLEGPEPIAQRRQSLDHVYQLAADMSFRSWSHVQHLEFGTLNNLNNRFSSEDANLAMAYRYNLFTRRKRFEGHRILSVMKPAIYICGGMNDPSGRELLMPAEVVIDVDPDR